MTEANFRANAQDLERPDSFTPPTSQYTMLTRRGNPEGLTTSVDDGAFIVPPTMSL